MTMLRRVANDCRIWGGVMYLFDSTSNNPYRYVGQLGYYTHWMDPSLSDLLHLGMRFYEPGVGRFGQVDPAREGLNWYGYVDGIPTAMVDPLGLVEWKQANIRGVPFAYAHSWLEFQRITCRKSKYYGFWPDGIHRNDSYGGKKSSRDKPISVVKSKDSEVFERFLCDCIKGSKATAADYHFPWYQCGSWAKEMWECAESKMQQYLLVFACRSNISGIMPKTPPGGD